MSPPPSIPPGKQRYQPTYREDEIYLIDDYVARGWSLCFIGIAGTGKGNIVTFLRDRPRYQPQPSSGQLPALFPVVDARTWQGSPTHLWQLMGESLRVVTTDLAAQPREETVVSMDEEERAYDRVRSRLRWLCQELGYRVMVILDDFDIAFQTGPLAMLERLNTLRSDGNKDLLSYLVFTKRLPHVLGRHFDLERESKFFDLFKHSQFALKPYSARDALQMLEHLNTRAGSPLKLEELESIQQLTGGHARLIAVCFETWMRDRPASKSAALGLLAAKTDVQQECERVWRGLHAREMDVALLVAQGAHTADQADVIDHLERRGVLVRQNPGGDVRWFSPLMERFLKAQASQGGTS